MSEGELVSAQEIVKRFGIPRSTLYYLAEAGKIPYHVAPRQPWHQRRHLLFNPEEVKAALDGLAADGNPPAE